MSEQRPPFDVKRMIRDLPELLEGPEPILGTAAAKETIRSDPEARAMLTAAAMTAATLTKMSPRATRRPIIREPGLLRSVEQARKFFATRLVESVFDVALNRLESRSGSD